MKKEILNEVNRTREIMGLGELIKENFIRNISKWTDFLETYKGELFDNVETVRPNIAGGYDFESWAADLRRSLMKVFRGDNLSRMGRDWQYMAWMLRPDMLDSDDGINEKVRLVQSKDSSDLVVIDDGREYTPDKWCIKLNEFNFKNFGTRQIVGWSYNKGESETERNIEAITDELIQFSTSRLKKTYQSVTKGGTEGEVAAQGEPIPGGSAFNVLEVIPDPGKMKQLIKQIQNSASKGNVVTNVIINGVASDEPIANVAVWRKNVGDKYSNFTDEQITTNTTGKFTQPKTGNQVLAYLRAQNLGKELEKVGITVDSYKYSVGGDEMKADVIINTEKPATEGTPGRTVGTETGTETDMAGQGIIVSMVVYIPGKITWKSQKSPRKKSVVKKEAEEVIIAMK